MPFPNIQSYPTSGSPTLIDNSPFYFSGECDIASSISTSSFELKTTIEEELISFFWISLNWTRNFFLPITLWTYPTTYLFILLLLPSLVIFSNSPTLAFTTDPTPIFVLVYFFISNPYWIVTTGELMVTLGGGGGANINFNRKNISYGWFVFGVKSHSKKKHKQTKIACKLRTNNSSLSKSYHASPRHPHSLTYQLQPHPSKTKNGLTCVYI